MKYTHFLASRIGCAHAHHATPSLGRQRSKAAP
jgi:hypothetical protein